MSAPVQKAPPGMDLRRRLGLQPANRAPRTAAVFYEVASTADSGATRSVLAERRQYERGGEAQLG